MTQDKAEYVAKCWVLMHYFAETPDNALENFDEFMDKFAQGDEETMETAEVWFVFEQYEPDQLVDYIRADVANLASLITRNS